MNIFETKPNEFWNLIRLKVHNVWKAMRIERIEYLPRVERYPYKPHFMSEEIPVIIVLEDKNGTNN